MPDSRTSPPRPRVVALQIKVPCATREELKKQHGLELSKGTFFVRTRVLKPPNTLVRFELQLEQGDPFLRGLGVVTKTQTEAEAPGQSGMLLQFRGLDATSHLFLHSIGLRVALPTIRAAVAGDPESRQFLHEPRPAPQPPKDEVIEARPKPVRQTGAPAVPPSIVKASSELPKAVPPPSISSVAARPSIAPPSATTTSGVTKSGVTKSGVTKSGVTKSGVTRSGITKPRVSTAPRSGPIVGVDFGTTRTLVAAFSNDSAQVVTKDGENYLQSLFGVDGRGFPLVGADARKAVVQAPQNAVRNGRRMVGRPALSEAIQQLQKAVPYALVPGKNGQVAASLAGHPFAMEDVASRLIGEAASWAETRLGRSVGRVAVTVPGAASVSQRQAIREAAELAGLTVERLVCEPVAIAVAHTSTRAADQKLAVFRMGAGSFDFAVLEQRGKTKLELLALGGDTLLGGGDIDQLLLDVLLKRFEEEQGAEFGDNPIIVQRFADAAEQAKIALSTKELFNVGIPFIQVTPAHAVDFDTTVTRSELEQLARPLVDRAIEITTEVLASARIRPADIGELIVAGGQGRMPLLLARLREVIGREPVRSAHIDEAAAIGAALIAHRIETRTQDGLRIDLVPTRIGVGIHGGTFQSLFERYAVPPRTVSHTVATDTENQPAIELCFFQGDSERAVENEFVGFVRVADLPPGPAGSVKLDFSVELTPDGTLNVSLREADGTLIPLLVELGRSPEELVALLGDKGPKVQRGGRMWKAVRGLFRRKKR